MRCPDKIITSLLSALLLPLLLITSLSANAGIKLGDAAPNFTASVSLNGEDTAFSLQQATSEGPVVIYFFPSAYTQGCDLEAHTFATKMDQFRAQNTRVIGVSADSLERLHQFSKDPDFCAGEFPLASDPNGNIAVQYGVAIGEQRQNLIDVRGDQVNHALFERATYVLAKGGKIVARFSSADDNLTPVGHVLQSLKMVTELNTH